MKKLLSIMLAVLLTLTAAIPAMADYLPTEGEVGKVYTKSSIFNYDFDSFVWPDAVTPSTTLTSTTEGDAFKSVAVTSSGYTSGDKTALQTAGLPLSSNAIGTGESSADFGIATDSDNNSYFHTGLYTNSAAEKCDKNTEGLKFSFDEIQKGVISVNFKVKFSNKENFDVKENGNPSYIMNIVVSGVKPSDVTGSNYLTPQFSIKDCGNNEWNDVTFEIDMDKSYPHITDKKLSFKTYVNGVLSHNELKAINGTIDETYAVNGITIALQPFSGCNFSVDDIKAYHFSEVGSPVSATSSVELVAEKSASAYIGNTKINADANAPYGTYEYITIDPAALGLGLKNITIVSKNGTTAKTAKAAVNFGKVIERGVGVEEDNYSTAATLQNFNSGWSNDGTVTSLVDTFNWNSYKSTLARAEGRNYVVDGSDYCLKVTAPSTETANTNCYIIPKSKSMWTKYPLVQTGKTKYSFDIKLSDDADILMNTGYTSWCTKDWDKNFLIKDNYVMDVSAKTTYAISPNKWYHFDMEIDFADSASNDAKGFWTVKVTDESGTATVVVTALQASADSGSETSWTGDRLKIGVYDPEETGAESMYIDNIRIWNEIDNSVSGVKVAGSDACGVVKTTDTALTVEFDSSVQATDAAASLNGAAVTPSFSADGKTVTIPLTGLSAHTDAEIVLTGLSGFETTPVSIALRVADKDGFYFKAEQSNAANGMVTVPVFFFNAGGEDKDISVLAASYRDNELTGISVLEYAADENLTAAEFELDEISSGDTVRIFLWNTLTDASPLQTFEAITK